MKTGIKILTGSLLYVLGVTSIFAATTIDHFNVSLEPSTARVGQTLDLIVEAVDKNGVTVTNYQGMALIFSESDSEATLPIVLEENTYTFKSSDLGKTKFENAVKFSQAGTQNIYVYDFNDDLIFGIAEVTISGGGTDTSGTQKGISIVSPENGLTIGDNKIKLSGTSEPNHQVKLLINGVGDTIIMTNAAGTFEKDITNLQEGENTFVAKLLDADEREIGTSDEVKIRVEKDTISLIDVKVAPEEVISEGAFEIEITATPGLREVQAIINDLITIVAEKESGKYFAKMYAPKEIGTHKIDVTLKDELGHEKKELGAASISVKAPLIVEPPVEDPIVEPNIPLNVPLEIGEKDLKITGLKLVELKSKSILTWDKLEDAKSYNVYKKAENGNLEFITNVTEPIFEVLVDMTKEEIIYEYFAIKAVGVAKNDEGEDYDYEGVLSEATKIQTGPEEIILLLLALLIGGMIMVFFGRKKA